MRKLRPKRFESVKSKGSGGSGSGPAGVDRVLLELLPERVAIDPEELGCADLVAPGLAHDGPQEWLLDQANHQPMEVCRGVPAQPADALVHLLLDDVFQRGVGPDGGGG